MTMTLKMRTTFATLLATAVVGALGVAPAASADVSTDKAARGHDATASVYHDDVLAARVKFNSDGDYFAVTKWSRYGNRAYMEYVYIRHDGTAQRGEHWGVSSIGNTVYFDHNFREGREVRFKACVQVDYWSDPCSAWKSGYA